MKLFKSSVALMVSLLLSATLTTATALAADYRVVPNDSLYKISVLFDTTISNLKSENQLSTNTIYPGQILDVPAQVYTVKSGDTLYRIAKDHNLGLTSLRTANNKWDNLIIPGQTLILPGVKSSQSSTETSAAKTVIPYTAKEVDLLARLITAETTGEPYEAMVGVGGVVVNRVQSNEWPNSITSVINQVINGYYQFTPVKNGSIHNTPSDAAVKAAWAALYGSDPSNGAQFYFDDSSTNQWMWSKPQTARIGSMVFVK